MLGNANDSYMIGIGAVAFTYFPGPGEQKIKLPENAVSAATNVCAHGQVLLDAFQRELEEF